MTPIGSVNPLSASALMRLDGPNLSPEVAQPAATAASGAVPTDAFSAMLDHLVGDVGAKDAAATTATNSVLMGNSGQLHQSVIAMQEAGVAFSLMVQVRNKLVESYQELMRMQV